MTLNQDEIFVKLVNHCLRYQINSKDQVKTKQFDIELKMYSAFVVNQQINLIIKHTIKALLQLSKYIRKKREKRLITLNNSIRKTNFPHF